MALPVYYVIKHSSGKFILRDKHTRRFEFHDIPPYLWEDSAVARRMFNDLRTQQHIGSVKILDKDITIETLTINVNQVQKPLVYKDKENIIYQYFKDNGTENVLHREGAPAFIVLDLNNLIVEQGYYINGKLHKEDGPAFIKFNKNSVHMSCEEYYINGLMHREDGPAKTYYDSSGKNPVHQYWIAGKSLSHEQFPIYKLNQIIAPYDLKVSYDKGIYTLRSIMPGLSEDEMRASTHRYTDLNELQNAITSYID